MTAQAIVFDLAALHAAPSLQAAHCMNQLDLDGYSIAVWSSVSRGVTRAALSTVDLLHHCDMILEGPMPQSSNMTLVLSDRSSISYADILPQLAPRTRRGRIVAG